MRTNRQTPRVLIAALAVAALALVVRAAPPVEAAGLTNCVELIGRAGACYETVWANGVQLRNQANCTASPPPPISRVSGDDHALWKSRKARTR